MSTNEEKYELEVFKKIVDCIQHNMTRREIGQHLAAHYNINPAFTQIVWEKLAEENEELMRAYWSRMEIRHQIYPETDLSNEQKRIRPFVPLANGSDQHHSDSSQPQRFMPRQVFGSNFYQQSDRVISFQPEPSPRQPSGLHQDDGPEHEPSGSESE